MDGTSEEISFDENGICNFCIQAQKSLKEIEAEKPNLNKIIERIKKDGQGKLYDCLVGLSGGVDSSTTLHHAVRLGLRPLCFNVDTGYNKPEADENVLKMVEKLKVPFYRYVIDLKKFKELQATFMKAGQKNIEIPTDAVLLAVSMELAQKNKSKWILSGGNVNSESVLPPSWGYNARDAVHVKDIFKKTTGKKLTGLPLCGLLSWNIYKWWNGIRTFYLLDFLDYNRSESIKLLQEKYGFKSTGEKHEENYFTWWFQNFYLFTKFGIDKRKAHYSSLINSGQMTRKEAMDLLADRPVYPQLGIEDKVMQYPKRSHNEFATDERLFNFISSVIRGLRKLSWKY